MPRGKPNKSDGCRSGRFSIEEEDFILREHTVLSIAEIAKKLNRRQSAIRNFIIKNGLGTPQDYKLRNKLYMKTYWKEVKEQLLEHEIEKFVVTWIEMMTQFNEDFQYSEELQLKQFILCEILIDRAIRTQTDCLKNIKECENIINQERAKNEPDLAIINLNTSSIQQYNAMSQQAGKDRIDLAKESEKLFRGLKGSRDQRITKIGDAHKSFSTALQILEEPSMREMIGKDIYLLHVAQQNATMKLYEYFKYDDGRYDNPILNHETYEYLGDEPEPNKEAAEKELRKALSGRPSDLVDKQDIKKFTGRRTKRRGTT